MNEKALIEEMAKAIDRTAFLLKRVDPQDYRLIERCDEALDCATRAFEVVRPYLVNPQKKEIKE